MRTCDYDLVFIGGGLAGLSAAAQLARDRYRILVLEKGTYPRHKVCGEFVGNEIRPYLGSLGLNLSALDVAEIRRTRISDSKGRDRRAPLPMGGFGVSRYRLDQAMVDLARRHGAEVREGAEVRNVAFAFESGRFQVSFDDVEISAGQVIAACGRHGKFGHSRHRRGRVRAGRFAAVKYHVRIDYPNDEIGLDIFPGGYCGISKIEGDLHCLCYLIERDWLRRIGNVEAAEEEVLSRNPRLRNIVRSIEKVNQRPIAVTGISLDTLSAVGDGIIRIGDAAGMIAPLCGNGMAMAVGSAEMLASLIGGQGLFRRGSTLTTEQRSRFEKEYARRWRRTFRLRLTAGRVLQGILLRARLMDSAMRVVFASPSMTRAVIGATHGSTIVPPISNPIDYDCHLEEWSSIDL